VVTVSGNGVVSHAGFRLLADLADRTGLTGALADALAGVRQRVSAHDPGGVLADLAVMLADGRTTISELAVLRDQSAVFGPVASTATAWRVLAGVNVARLSAVRSARERLWAQCEHVRPGPAGRS